MRGQPKNCPRFASLLCNGYRDLLLDTEELPKAGGTGLNLTAADMVIHYDPWWNAAAQNQATDRTHRIGQEKQVTVFQMIMKDTIEENIMKLQAQKKNLADQIISGERLSLSSLTKEELLKLLS